MTGKGKDRQNKGKKVAVLSLLAGMLLPVAAPLVANADDCLNGPSQPRSLRVPLIPSAPNAAPGQVPFPGQAPPIGDGRVPRPLIPGDMGGPHGVSSGFADPTHGNIFPPLPGGNMKGPGPYVPGAGRHGTQYGQQQGMYEYGQGSSGQGTYENGAGNGGRGRFESGAGNNGQGSYESGSGNGGQGSYESGSGNGGQGSYESGSGNGGQGTMESGGGNGGQGSYESGAGNGGQGTFEGGGGNGGQGTTESGAGNGGKGTMEGGGGNGGLMLFDMGGGNGGQQIVNNGGSNGQQEMGKAGPRPDARQDADRILNGEKQGPKYDFQGPLPTVRTFSRYLVILGVVMGTVFMALAGWSVVLGARNGGARVIGAAGGLLLLLAGYTIWKIVQMNTFDFNSTGVWAKYRDGSQQQVTPNGGGNPPGPFAPPGPPGVGR
ncbi:MAG: hypothetical protein K2W95_02380 [Candidatus Obscuribacterales bacterium]|nr:hypothetical protein [Candidatus Obscuribacterales bacterium]